MITFKPTRSPSAIVTRAQADHCIFKVGAFYAIQPTSASQEFLIAKCLKPSNSGFEGLVLEKCSEVVSDLLIFREKKERANKQ